MNDEIPNSFIEELTQNQLAIKGYVRSSLGTKPEADDVVQKVNLVLWKKASQWDQGVSFLTWAIGVARFEVLAFYRDKQRDRLVFDESTMELMAQEAVEICQMVPDRVVALRECLGTLSTEQSKLISAKYTTRMKTKELAEMSNRSEEGVRSLLLRIRQKLNRCIVGKLKQMET